jgi:hypothetical protein
MINPVIGWEDYSQEYKIARERIEVLCVKIVLEAISAEKADSEYEGIEAEYTASDPENAGLFRMIYRNRVKRLSSQFPPRSK